MSPLRLDNLFLYDFIIALLMGKSRKSNPFRDECIVDFSAVRFYGMEFLFVGRPQFPVFNGIMVHPALFGYVAKIRDRLIDRTVFKACKDALKNGSQRRPVTVI